MATEAFNIERDDPDIRIVNGPGQHGHPEEGDLVDTAALIQLMLQQVAADPSVPSRRVYNMVRIYFVA